MDIIPPKDRPRRNPFALAAAQGRAIELTFRVAELEAELHKERTYRRVWKAAAYCLIAWIIFR